MSSSNCFFLTWIQISQEAGQVVWYSHLLKNFPQFVVIHTVKGFGIVSKAEICVFLEHLLFWWSSGCWHLTSGSSTFSKTILNIWKFISLKEWQTSMKYLFLTRRPESRILSNFSYLCIYCLVENGIFFLFHKAVIWLWWKRSYSLCLLSCALISHCQPLDMSFNFPVSAS